MSERQIDNAIDDALRDLMNVDADPAFRARVVGRLHKPSVGRVPWRQLTMASAAVAALVTTAVLFRSGNGPAVQQLPLSSTASGGVQKVVPADNDTSPVGPSRPPAPGGGATRRIVADPPMPMPARNVTQKIPSGSLRAAVADVADVGIVERSSFRPIALEPIAPAAIRAPELVIAPLAPISQIVIAPLDSRLERN